MILADIVSLWKGAWPAGVTMLALGAGFALVLLIAKEKLRVEVDANIEKIAGALPGIDCGACGFAGCGSYAKAVVANPELIGKCAPGGAEVSAKIAELLNLQVSGGGAPMRPIVYCRAHSADRASNARYTGIETCTSANAFACAQSCKFGCMGFGDCVNSCKFSAIEIIDGLATVNYEKCTGCGACAHACPRNIIKMVPFSRDDMVVVACSSQENGKNTRAMCGVGCIACKMCTRQFEAFEMGGNLAKVDYQKIENTPEPPQDVKTAVEKCPTKVIVYRGKTAPADIEPAKKAEAS